MADWFDEQGNPNIGADRYGNPRGGALNDELARQRAASGGGGVVSLQDWYAGTGGSAAAAGGGGGGGQGGGNGQYQQYSDMLLQDILHKYPPTNDGIRQAVAEIDRTFGPGVVELLEHPSRLDKLRLPGGRVVDTIMGAGGANPSWGWITEGAGGGGGGGAAGGLGGMLGSGNVATDPSFQFRLQEGQKALERSAAAKGTLLTGGTAKALTRYAQDYASTEFGNIYNRLMGVANLGLNAANSAAATGSGYSNTIGANNRGFGGDYNEYGAQGANAGATDAAGRGANNAGLIGNLGQIGAEALREWARRRAARGGGGGAGADNQGPPFIPDGSF